MKKLKSFLLLLTVFVTGVSAITILVMPLGGQSTDPVWVEIVSPTPGEVISGTNVLISVQADSRAGPITKVEFYRDGVLFQTWTNDFSVSHPSFLRAF